MNDNCLGELHLLANTFFVGKYYVVMIYYTVHFFFREQSTLCKYIIQSNIEDLWWTIVENQYTNKKSRQLKVIIIYTYSKCTYFPIKYIYIYIDKWLICVCVYTYVTIYIYE